MTIWLSDDESVDELELLEILEQARAECYRLYPHTEGYVLSRSHQKGFVSSWFSTHEQMFELRKMFEDA